MCWYNEKDEAVGGWSFFLTGGPAEGWPPTIPCTPLPRSAMLLPMEHPLLLWSGAGEVTPRTQHTCMCSDVFFLRIFLFLLPFTSQGNSVKNVLKGGGVFGQCGSLLAPCKWPRWGGTDAHAPLDSPLFPLSPFPSLPHTLSHSGGAEGDVMRTSAVASRFLIANLPTLLLPYHFPGSRKSCSRFFPNKKIFLGELLRENFRLFPYIHFLVARNEPLFEFWIFVFEKNRRRTRKGRRGQQRPNHVISRISGSCYVGLDWEVFVRYLNYFNYFFVIPGM